MVDLNELTALKHENERRSLEEFHQRREVVTALPVQLEFELTSKCNLRCFTCPKTYEKNAGEHNTRENFEQLAGATLEAAQSINLSGFGEPMLAPDFEQIFNRCVEAGLDVGFVTNGTCITEKWLERFLAARVHVFLSLDAATEKTMADMRPQLKFGKLLTIVDRWAELQRQMPDSPAQLYLNFVPTLKNIHELPLVVELAAKWRVRRMELMGFNSRFLPESVLRERLDNDPPRARRYIEEARARAEALSVQLLLPPGYEGAIEEPGLKAIAENCDAPIEINPPGGKYPLACSAPWFRILVKHHGAVYPCCGTPWPIDNLTGKTFEEVWNGEAMRRLRRKVNSRFPQLVCKQCHLIWGIAAGAPDLVFAREGSIDRTHTWLQRLKRRIRR